MQNMIDSYSTLDFSVTVLCWTVGTQESKVYP